MVQQIDDERKVIDRKFSDKLQSIDKVGRRNCM